MVEALEQALDVAELALSLLDGDAELLEALVVVGHVACARLVLVLAKVLNLLARVLNLG